MHLSITNEKHRVSIRRIYRFMSAEVSSKSFDMWLVHRFPAIQTEPHDLLSSHGTIVWERGKDALARVECQVSDVVCPGHPLLLQVPGHCHF